MIYDIIIHGKYLYFPVVIKGILKNIFVEYLFCNSAGGEYFPRKNGGIHKFF